MRAPIKMAVTESPGIPRVSIVVKAPPITPLLDVALADNPSKEPLPYFFLFFENFFVCSQLTIEAMSPPAPGIAPINTDVREENQKGFLISFLSFLLGIKRPIVFFVFSFTSSLDVI